MKLKSIVCFAVITGLLAGCACDKSEKAEKHQRKEARLTAEAKVSKDDAEKTATVKVPNGTLKDSEIEKEHGKLIWSFEFSSPDSANITEVNVDAISGDIVNVESEKPEKDND